MTMTAHFSAAMHARELVLTGWLGRSEASFTEDFAVLHILVGVLAASWNLFLVTACRIKILQTLLPPKWPPLTKCPSTHWAKPVQRGALQCLWAGSAGYKEGRARWIPQNSKCFSSCSSNSAQAYSLVCWTQDFVLSFSGRGFEHC